MPPREESLRHSGEWIIISERPDICLTPISGLPEPVPYNIIARGQDSVGLATRTNFTGQPVFHFKSKTSTVVGNEPGIAGGITSGVNRAVCYPIGCSPSVNIEGSALVRHDDPFAMNAAEYGVPGNTVGYAVWKETPDVEASDPPAWYERAYGSAQNKINEINQQFKKAEDKFGKSVKKFISTDPSTMTQPLGEGVAQFGETLKDRGSQLVESITSIPERVMTSLDEHGVVGSVVEYGEGVVTGVVTGVAQDIPETLGNIMDNVSEGNWGKAVGDAVADGIETGLKAVGAKKVGLTRDAKSEIDKAKSNVQKAKEKVKATQKQQKSNNKALRKTGGRIKGSPKEKAEQRKNRRDRKQRKEDLQKQNRINQAELADAKTKLNEADANKLSYDLKDAVKLPEPQEATEILGSNSIPPPDNACTGYRLGGGGKGPSTQMPPITGCE